MTRRITWDEHWSDRPHFIFGMRYREPWEPKEIRETLREQRSILAKLLWCEDDCGRRPNEWNDCKGPHHEIENACACMPDPDARHLNHWRYWDLADMILDRLGAPCDS